MANQSLKQTGGVHAAIERLFFAGVCARQHSFSAGPFRQLSSTLDLLNQHITQCGKEAYHAYCNFASSF